MEGEADCCGNSILTGRVFVTQLSNDVVINMLVNNQLDAHFFFYICLFQFSTRFEQPRAHHQENQLYQRNIWYMSL
jgi:hypothetical protein